MFGIVFVVLVFVIILASMGIKMVRQAQVLVIERLGRFDRIAQSGLNFILPIVEYARPFLLDGRQHPAIDMREQVLDFLPQPVITKDNVTMQVDAVIFYQVTDAFKAMYEISDLSMAIRQLTITSLRNVMGELALDETLVSRETVNTKLRGMLDHATDKWGVKVSRVEIKNIEPPAEIQAAMAKQMKAERERRATVTEAEGAKKAAILVAEGKRDAAVAEAEGEKKAQVLRSEGQAEATITVKRAEAAAIKMTYDAIHAGRPTKELVAIKYLETLSAMADGQASKVFIPYEATAILGTIAGFAGALKSGPVTNGSGGEETPTLPQAYVVKEGALVVVCCPKCGKKFNVTDILGDARYDARTDVTGQQVKCSGCNTEFTLRPS